MSTYRMFAWLALGGYLAIYALGLAWPPIRSDGFSYYVYLPAWVLHHDPSLEATAAECCEGTFPVSTAIFRSPTTGRWVDPHPIGEAILLLPFFLVGHVLSWLVGLPRTGFSGAYQMAVGAAGSVYLGAGLALLQRVLARRFSAGVTLATLASILWGTNLYHYATYDATFSHVYSFFLLAAFLWATPLWFERPSMSKAVLLGIIAGLIVLVRHVDALFLLFFLLYGIDGWRAVRARTVFFLEHRGDCLVFGAVVAACLLPQVLIYHAATGAWLSSPYGPNGSFNFANPEIVRVLFGTEKGLFFWSPMLLLGVAGFVRMRRAAPQFLLPGLIVLPCLTLLIASWSDWQMGGSFGHRGFTDVLPFFALGLASFYDWARATAARSLVFVAAPLLVLLSVAQMVQYWLRIIPFSHTTWELYWSVFLRFHR